MDTQNIIPGTGGDRYVPYEERTGAESTVYFTRDLSPEGLRRMAALVTGKLTGKVAVKLHTGEPYGPNIIPADWVRALIENDLPDATIVETNTFYQGDRYTTEAHRETLKVNGWTFCPVDITDEEGSAMWPVEGGKWFAEMAVGAHLANYDSMLTLTHFKGHTMGGFGGANKNIGIGCASGQVGKAMIHRSDDGEDFGVDMEPLMERITESTKATIDHFGDKVVYVSVLRNMSVSCDCEGCGAEPVVTPDIGILASTDILAIDSASVDLVYALDISYGAAMRERIETRHGHRQLSYMKELNMGNDRYQLIDTDNGDAVVNPEDCVTHVVPFVELPIVKKRREEFLARMAAMENGEA